MKQTQLKIGLFGGSFDPIHVGHLQMANWTKEKLSLNRVFFIPAAIPPHKQNVKLTESVHRRKMIQLALESQSNLELSTIEIERNGISYSIDTVCYFKNLFHLCRENLFWLIGSDNLLDFQNWYQPEKIIDNCMVAVYKRPGLKLDKVDSGILKKVLLLDSPLINISATRIRQKIKLGESVESLIPAETMAYIIKHKLYI